MNLLEGLGFGSGANEKYVWRQADQLLIHKYWSLHSPLIATIKAPPTTTINIVSADLPFLSLSASRDSTKICLGLLCFFFITFLGTVLLLTEEGLPFNIYDILFDSSI